MGVDELELIVADVHDDKKISAIARLSKILMTLTSDVPGIGKLAEQTINRLAEYSAHGKVQSALKALGVEATEAQRVAQVAQAVHTVLSEHFHTLNAGQRAITEALMRLDAWLEATRQEIAGGQDVIYQKLVSGGAIGTTLEPGRDRGADIRQGHVTGQGTTGVVIKGR